MENNMDNIIENQQIMRKVNFWFKVTMIFELVNVGIIESIIVPTICILITCNFGILFIILLITGLMRKNTIKIKIGIIIHGVAMMCLIVLGLAFIFLVKEEDKTIFNKTVWMIDVIIYCISFALYIKAYMCSKQNDYLKTQEGYPEFNQLCMEMKNKRSVEPKFEFDYSHDDTMEEITPPEIL